MIKKLISKIFKKSNNLSAVTVEGTELDLDTQAAIKNYYQNEINNARYSTLVLTETSDITFELVEFGDEEE